MAFMQDVVCCVIINDNKILATQRREDQAYPLKWQLPGGKIEKGETAAVAAARECKEELGIQVRFNWRVMATRIYDRKFVLHYMRAISWEGEPKNLDAVQMRWLELKDLNSVDWLPDDLIIARYVLSGSMQPRLTWLKPYGE